MKEMTWASFLSCVACVLIVAYAAFGIPYIEYCKAVSLQKDGKIIEAYDAYIALGDYKDSKEKAATCDDRSIRFFTPVKCVSAGAAQ